jgi:replicative DNA helicase
LQKSDLLIIAGRPAWEDWLSALGGKECRLKHKKRVAIFSLEMSNEQLVQRLIAQETGIDTQKMRTASWTRTSGSCFVHALKCWGRRKSAG